MDTYPIFTCMLLCFCMCSTAGQRMRIGKCVITRVKQSRPRIDRDHHCITVGVYHVCREWQCPPVSCFDDRGGKGNCRVCPDTCIDGGNVYQPGQRFLSVDGVNMCLCGNDIIPKCSRRRRVSFISMCLM
ncbi:uncharacterized protein LOC110452080 [Mizuhopecten yessoensis]|uniref:uncharacterized protein LOC110452080 n=1 Tax=Mizuhopecten yessoensis TaxID=6573 RepID=UPI000B45F349|nr:uncharacterized protein LOC110452080 [Mizuhopecten yessoensis]